MAHEASGRRAAAVQVYGMTSASGNSRGTRGAAAREGGPADGALARELGGRRQRRDAGARGEAVGHPAGDRCTAARKKGETLRLDVAAGRAEFSLRPQQGDVRAVRPLARFSGTDQAGKVNTILVAGVPASNAR